MLDWIMNNFEDKNKKLEELSLYLKKQFIGIDSTIDRVIESITPWYIFQESFNKPYVVPIWGPTGTGKTQLVEKLCDFLGLNKNYTDVKELLSKQDNFYLRYQTCTSFKQNDNVFIFDEFQNCSSKTIFGPDKQIKNMAGYIFKFLSEGLTNQLIPIDFLMNKLCLNLAKTISTNYKSPELNKEMIMNSIKVLESNSTVQFSKDKGLLHSLKNPEISEEIKFKLLTRAIERFQNKAEPEVKDKEYSSSDYDLSSIFYEKVNKNNPLVFILGNLDELIESIVNEVNSCDEMKERILKKNNSDVMKVLENLFTPEEMSRIGFNHIVFPTLTLNEYKGLINQKINETINLLNKENIKVSFSEKLTSFIYSQIIHPKFGARSINSSYRQIFESAVIQNVLAIYRSTKCNNFNIDIENSNKFLLINDKKIEIQSLKKEEKLYPPKIHNQIAVHESGHALAYYLLNNQAPEYIQMKLSTTDIGGFVKMPYIEELKTKKTLKNQIKVSLAGIVSEKIMFGEDNISAGSYSDLNKATSIAQSMIYRLGMGKNRNIYDFSSNAVLKSYEQEANQEVTSLIQECDTEVTVLLIENKELIEKLVTSLNKTNKLSGDDFLRIVKS